MALTNAELTDIINLVGSDIGALGRTTHPYASRSAIQSDAIPAVVDKITALTPTGQIVAYRRTSGSKYAVRSNTNTVNWEPYLAITPQHFGENTTPGTTDMTTAVRAMLDYLAVDTPWPGDLRDSSMYREVTALGEQIGLSEPVIVGRMDANQDGTFELGCGPIANVKFIGIHWKALSGFDTSNVAGDSTIGCPMLYVGDYRTAMINNDFMVNHILFEDNQWHCMFRSSGIYFENTFRSGIIRGHSFDYKKNGYGVKTAPFNAANSTRAFGSRNNGWKMVDHYMSGNFRGDGVTDWPSGEDTMSMNQTGFVHMSGDSLVDGAITSAVATSMAIYGSATIFSNLHPWANKIDLYSTAKNNLFMNCYWDFTDINMYGSFEHHFIGGNLLFGDCNYNLYAQDANETAEGLLISDFRVRESSTINFLTDGGSWVAAEDRKLVIGPNYSEAGDIPRFQLGDQMIMFSAGSTLWKKQLSVGDAAAGVGVQLYPTGSINARRSGTGSQSNITIQNDNGTVGAIKSNGSTMELQMNSGGGLKIVVNFGTPEGSVSASVGSICMDTQNGNVYRKASGYGNTGWVTM